MSELCALVPRHGGFQGTSRSSEKEQRTRRICRTVLVGAGAAIFTVAGPLFSCIGAVDAGSTCSMPGAFILPRRRRSWLPVEHPLVWNAKSSSTMTSIQSGVICSAMPRKPIRHGRQTTPTDSDSNAQTRRSSPSNSSKSHDRVDESQSASGEPSTSSQYALDPTSEEATKILQSTLQLTQEQHDQLIELCHSVVKWNDSINLISRKDCNVDVVFGRHVLPSLALLNIPDSPFRIDDNGDKSVREKVVDIGTGGGFPGLPLAIACGSYDFTLVDSVGKKVKVVQSMADELGLTNVNTHHGRAEEMIFVDSFQHKQQYGVCVGRSVAPLPRFCTWIDGLLSKEDGGGKLVYIIGGDVDEVVISRVETDVMLEDVLDCSGASDKRALVLTQASIAQIASKNGRKAVANSARTNFKAKLSGSNKPKSGGKKQPRGAWKKKDNTPSPAKQDRDYGGFKRFEF
jgi:16S rRNA (guanine527-N7)-methyltransferase